MFDNVYSGNTAETPIKTPIPEPDMQRVQDFRQTLSNWFRVAVSFETTLWLLCFMTVRRWNIRAFLRYVDDEHRPKLFRSQEACWHVMVSKYSNPAYNPRGPTLDAIPPEKRIVQPLAPIEPIAISDQHSADESPPSAKRFAKPPDNISGNSKAPGPPAPAERIDELLAERGVDNARWYAWMYARSPRPKWPLTESEVLRWIEVYLKQNAEES